MREWIIFPPFFTVTLDGGEWSASRPGHFYLQGKNPAVPIGSGGGWTPELGWML
jgi:hypothetical protein